MNIKWVEISKIKNKKRNSYNSAFRRVVFCCCRNLPRGDKYRSSFSVRIIDIRRLYVQKKKIECSYYFSIYSRKRKKGEGKKRLLNLSRRKRRLFRLVMYSFFFSFPYIFFSKMILLTRVVSPLLLLTAATRILCVFDDTTMTVVEWSFFFFWKR